MSCFDKQHYKQLKQFAKLEGILLGTHERWTANYSGLSVAIQLPPPGLRMAKVAVSYCSPEDEFKPKHGKYQAMLKFMGGEYVQIPVEGTDLRTITEDMLNHFSV